MCAAVPVSAAGPRWLRPQNLRRTNSSSKRALMRWLSSCWYPSAVSGLRSARHFPLTRCCSRGRCFFGVALVKLQPRLAGFPLLDQILGAPPRWLPAFFSPRPVAVGVPGHAVSGCRSGPARRGRVFSSARLSRSAVSCWVWPFTSALFSGQIGWNHAPGDACGAQFALSRSRHWEWSVGCDASPETVHA